MKIKDGYLFEPSNEYSGKFEPPNFKNLVKEIFEKNGFHVAEIDYESFVTRQDLRQILQKNFEDQEVARILISFPDFFVLHESYTPIRGTFFVICCAQERLTFTKRKYDCLRKYFPIEWILLVWPCALGDRSCICCERLSNFEVNYWNDKVELRVPKSRSLSVFLEEQVCRKK